MRLRKINTITVHEQRTETFEIAVEHFMEALALTQEDSLDFVDVDGGHTTIHIADIVDIDGKRVTTKVSTEVPE